MAHARAFLCAVWWMGAWGCSCSGPGGRGDAGGDSGRIRDAGADAFDGGSLDSGPRDSGPRPDRFLPDAGYWLDGWVPTVERETPLPCEDWTSNPPATPPEPGPWGMLWRWSLSDVALAELRTLTDFEAPTLGRESALGVDRVYVQMGDGAAAGIGALTFDGALIWGRNLPLVFGTDVEDHEDDNTLSAVAATPDGDVLIATTHHEVLAFSRDGSLRWAFVAELPWGSPVAPTAPATIALGPAGRIYYAPANEPRVFALDRCGRLHWTAVGPGLFVDDLSFRELALFVAADGALFVVAPTVGIFRFEPDGSVRRLYDAPARGVRVQIEALQEDGSLHMTRGTLAELTSGPRSSRVDGASGAIAEEVVYPTAMATQWPLGVLEPFGIAIHEQELVDGGYSTRVNWLQPGVEEVLTYVGPAFGASARLAGDRFVVVPVDLGAPGPMGLLAVTRPDSISVNAASVGPLANPRLAVDAAGRLLATDGDAVWLVQLDAPAGPGWTQHGANAWRSRSLAIKPR